jgi:hypothetical protein
MALPRVVNAQPPAVRPILIEAEGHLGYSAVDVERWARSKPYDWTQATSGGSLRLLIPASRRAYVGIEYGSHYLFWYEKELSYGGYSEYDVESQHVNAIVRLAASPNLDIDIGTGLHFIDDFTDVGLHIGANYRLFDRPRFSIPLGIRIDPVLDSDAAIVPMLATLGVSLKLTSGQSGQRVGPE